ncbi:hypothetical protein RM572_23670 [Streptomyces sp. DSM 42041]|uniref:Uncharacterized protein n=1 Tax=Streptomyces hazeniae TaxID=3075538 RepID=A0ABU2NXR1_9ACTN|nr:hypothetical protein [Streptomyces sp. DSM 42041]MDT0381763.1 hypothetical protein [Streptomyces sp. DSM 42041]
MRASWTTVVRLCREVAYGIDAVTAVRHGRQPGVPPYPPPSLFSAPSDVPARVPLPQPRPPRS